MYHPQCKSTFKKGRFGSDGADETSWATASPGEAGDGVTYRVPNKPGVSKGGQAVII